MARGNVEMSWYTQMCREGLLGTCDKLPCLTDFYQPTMEDIESQWSGPWGLTTAVVTILLVPTGQQSQNLVGTTNEKS